MCAVAARAVFETGEGGCSVRGKRRGAAGSVTRNLLAARHAANDVRIASIAGAPQRRADSAGSHIRQGMMGVSARASARAAQWLIGDI
ncbi:hypothetical protein EMIT0111MI5_140069 [Burkholderia sp. IT-111MI5]